MLSATVLLFQEVPSCSFVAFDEWLKVEFSRRLNGKSYCNFFIKIKVILFFYKDFFILRITGLNELPVFAKNHEAQKLL